MSKIYIILFIFLAFFGNSFCQITDLSEKQVLKFNEDNDKINYSLLDNGIMKSNNVIKSSFVKSDLLNQLYQSELRQNRLSPFGFKNNNTKYLIKESNDDLRNGYSYEINLLNPGNKKLFQDFSDSLNTRYPLWVPIVEIIGMHGGVCLISNYVLHNDFAKISFKSVKKNFETGFVWDPDLFNTNFLAHPFNGSLYYNCARSNGYDYYASSVFAFGGSLTWELFMETEPPAINDIINTTISGIFLGEATHRLSSLIIDERKGGFERVITEIAAGLVDIPRGINRLFQGKSWRISNHSYEKEPLAISGYYGVNWNNYGTKIGTGIANGVLGVNLLYGDPFVIKNWKPMDFFRLSGSFNIGAGQPVAGSLEGYGILTGKTTNIPDNSAHLFGLFHHYDYLSNQAYNIGAVSFGVGWISKYSTSKNSLLVSAIHFNAMPLGGSKSIYVDTVERTYSFGSGLNTKLETSLNFSWGSFYIGYNIYWYYTFVGAIGNEIYGILRPKVTINITKNIGIGAQFMFAHKSAVYHDYANINARTTQSMLLLNYTFGNMNFLK